jgi:methyl-accepting chemotaxis protein
LKKVVGRTDIEDSLARLDRLTQEEVRMAAAQGLKATHVVHDEVKSADDHIHQVDTHVQVIDDHIQQVDDRVQGVGGDVQQIGTHVQGVDDKVQGVDNRIQGVEGKIQDVDNKVQQVTDHMGYQKRSSSNNLILLAIMMNAQLLSQAISYERTSETGSPPQIHL